VRINPSSPIKTKAARRGFVSTGFPFVRMLPWYNRRSIEATGRLPPISAAGKKAAMDWLLLFPCDPLGDMMMPGFERNGKTR
jgi:hypothetical protein